MAHEDLEEAKKVILQYLGGTLRRLKEDMDKDELTEKEGRRTKVVIKFLQREISHVQNFEAPK